MSLYIRAIPVMAGLAALAACNGDGAAEQEVCGYRCSATGSCPGGYACYADGRCHLIGTPANHSCGADVGPDVPPAIVDTYPVDLQAEVPRESTIRAIFTEPVLGVDATTLTLRRLSAFEAVDFTVSYDDSERTATLVPALLLDVNMSYVVTVRDGITDTSGMALAGRSWAFTTVRDMTGPRVVSRSPADGATGVGVEDPVVVTFSERVAGVTWDSFIVRDPRGNAVGWNESLSPQLARNTGPWAPNTTYTVTLTPAITDVVANPLAGAPVIWSFTTGPDTAPPQITVRVPEADEEDVQLTTGVRVYFSEPMIGISPATAILEQLDGTAVRTSVRTGATSTNLVIEPGEPFAPDTTYRVRLLPGITDTSGNPVVPGVLSWTFTTSVEP